MHAQHIATRLGPVSIPTLGRPENSSTNTALSSRPSRVPMPSFVSSAGYRSPLASPQRPAAAEASGSRWEVPPPATAAATKAAPPVMQEAMAGPIEAAEQRDAEWLVTLDANDKLIESLAARVRAPPGARLERRLSAPA